MNTMIAAFQCYGGPLDGFLVDCRHISATGVFIPMGKTRWEHGHVWDMRERAKRQALYRLMDGKLVYEGVKS